MVLISYSYHPNLPKVLEAPVVFDKNQLSSNLGYDLPNPMITFIDECLNIINNHHYRHIH